MYVSDRDMYLLRNVRLTCKVATCFQSQNINCQYISLQQEIELRLQVCYIDSIVCVSESKNFVIFVIENPFLYGHKNSFFNNMKIEVFNDFQETASVINEEDSSVCSDNTIIHLA